MTFNPEPLTFAVENVDTEADEALAEIRRLEQVEAHNIEMIAEQEKEIDRLEAIISGDPHMARITDLEKQLHEREVQVWTAAVENNVLRAAIAHLNDAVSGLTAMATSQGERIVELEGEADRAAEDLEAKAALIDRQADRIVVLEDYLAECQGDTDEPDPIIVGGSHFKGYPAAKALVAPAHLDAFRKFCDSSKIEPDDLEVIEDVVADEAMPFVSVHRATGEPALGVSADTVHNVETLIDAGLHDAHGAIIIAHEPTQKMSGPDFVAMVTANLPHYREHLSNWLRLLCFMAFDFKDRSLPRHPANYLPADLNLVDGIAVDVYDKGKADAQGNGKTFAQLMEPAEQFARDMGLPIYITEAGAPDTGQWGRRDGWKPAWYVGAWAHMNDSYLLDGQPLYRSFLPFNSHIGDPPPAVTGPPPIKAGWYSDTTEEARLAYVDILQRSQAW